MIYKNSKAVYPSHQIDPREKGKDWCLQYAKAAWSDYTNHSTQSFHNNRGHYAKIKDYAQGNQSINKYKQFERFQRQEIES